MTRPIYPPFQCSVPSSNISNPNETIYHKPKPADGIGSLTTANNAQEHSTIIARQKRAASLLRGFDMAWEKRSTNAY